MLDLRTGLLGSAALGLCAPRFQRCMSCLQPRSLAVMEGPSSASFSACYLAVSVYQVFQTDDAEAKTSSLVSEVDPIRG